MRSRYAECALIALTLFEALAHAQPSPTLIFTNAKVWTGNPRQKEAEAVAISGNRIVAVGESSEILKLKQRDSTVIDLHGRRVLPGFNDSHVHFYDGGAALAGPQLRYSKSTAEFRDTLATFVRHLGRGEMGDGRRVGSRELIDRVTQDWPVFIAAGRTYVARQFCCAEAGGR